MADKSAFVPVDAIGNHKNTDLDVDIGRQVVRNKAAKPGKFQYKKSSTYQKTYAK
ncbi:Transposase [Caenorhabditis elegans]|uniref:Transposase n=1 Tax=Caenorhabditis elegans TaxID=6239 RepID=Q7YTL2_CAEEL|nr:Transposase [Caenorhabditis elegans]CAE17893.1 Transposase [Caenorhabditis elegans]|eukprot:NP_001023325.1 Uncharacterized protein CELE_M199.8 [Caenorhabditis elegans]